VTCIVGVTFGRGKVMLAGDSAGTADHHVVVRKDPKVFVRGPFAFGCCGSFRAMQLLRYSLPVIAQPPGMDPHELMVTAFIDAVRALFKDGGIGHSEDGVDTGHSFLVGFAGRLFEVEEDYQVGESGDPYAAVGCGREYALGSLHASARRAPRQRLIAALDAAAKFSGAVRGPYLFAEAE
jgi:hypothetical protein